jgi:hypothetical protein
MRQTAIISAAALIAAITVIWGVTAITTNAQKSACVAPVSTP